MLTRTDAARGLLAFLIAAFSAAQLDAGETAERGPEVWSVVIGIDGYQSFPRCASAVLDARAVGQHFVKAGWGDDHVLFLNDFGDLRPGKATDPARPLKPTRSNLDWAIKDWLACRLKPDDLAVLYFAGHAVGLPSRPDSPPGTRPRDYLLPIDARADDLEATGWQIDEAIDRLASKSQNSFICWLATSLHGRGELVVKDRELWPTGQRLLASLTRWSNITVWLASDERVALEGAQRGQLSPFTAGLLGALGTRERPNSVLGALHELRLNREVTRQGLRVRGGVAPGLSLWPEKMKHPARPARELVVQRGHADRIRGIAVTADGLEVITASMDSTLRIWRVADRSLYRVRADHSKGIQSLALSADGRWVVTGDGAGRVRVWDRVDQELRQVADGPPPHSGNVDSISFLPGSRQFVSLDSRAGRLLLWDLTAARLHPRPLIESGTTLVACTAVAESGARGDPPALVAAGTDGRIRLFQDDGSERKAQEGIDEFCTAIDISVDGWTLVLGGENGTVAVREAATGRVIMRRKFDEKIHTLRLVGSGLLAVGVGERLGLISLGEDRAVDWQVVPGGVGSLILSADGRYLAACGTATLGTLHLWSIEDGPGPRLVPVPLPRGLGAGAGPEADAGSTPVALAFSPDGRMLVAGDDRGGLRSWSLPEGELRFNLPPNRRKVATLSVSHDGAHLLQITTDGAALVWDLKKGRGIHAVDGNWTAGAFLPDSRTLVMTEGADRGGSVVLVDHSSGRIQPVTFQRPAASGANLPVATVFDKVAVGPGGRTVAAASSRDHKPLVCIWDVGSGALIHAIRDLESLALTCLDFSPDGTQLLTGLDRSAKLWDLAGDRRAPSLLKSIDLGEPVECAAFGRHPSRLIGLGTHSGRVLLWKGGRDEPDTLPGDPLDGPVRAITFTPDGRFLTAAGEDKRLAVWSLGERPESIRLSPSPQHEERINALAAWPDSRMIVSGSDDTTIRFWSLDERRLLATFSAFTASGPATKVPAARVPADWVIFTPEGTFDSSPRGGDGVRWSYDGEVRTLEQYERKPYFHPELSDELRLGRRPASVSLPDHPPPALTLELTSQGLGADREATLTITLREPDLSDVRLYQNGVPVQSLDDFQRCSDPRRFIARVRLRSGVNRFSAMASRPDAIDGRSRDVEVRYDGPETPGQLHVLALGVSNYRRRALQYADRDAEEIAAFLHRQGGEASGKEGLCQVLTNQNVTLKNVQNALLALRDRVMGRPEDTIVVFLAGHTKVSDAHFSMLLPTYPFEERDPPQVAARGSAVGPRTDSAWVLPYALIYSNLARLGALQRLVIIDACRAEAIFNDPDIRSIQRFMATSARGAKTAYILATHEGQSAGEVAELKHGLLTYDLLRGLGASPAGPRLEDLPIFGSIPNADFDADGMINSDELRRYADRTLPALVKHYQHLLHSGDDDRSGRHLPDDVPGRQAVEIRSADALFPLVSVKRGQDVAR